MEKKQGKLIAEQIIKMVKEDQAMRTDSQNDISKWDEELDKRNCESLKEIIKKIGWPTISKVGKLASNGAWLIAQHSDYDIEFQKKCLNLMKDETDDIRLANIAYLTDRILVSENRKQIYGTQFYVDDNDHVVPLPIKDMESLSKRRAQMGLEPFENYKRKMEKTKW